MPGSPTVRFEKQDPRQPRMGWKGGENETEQANVKEERWPALGGTASTGWQVIAACLAWGWQPEKEARVLRG